MLSFRAAGFRLAAAASLLVALAGPSPAGASFEPQLRDLYLKDIAAILADPAITAAITAQNARSAALTEAEIDALDKSWRTEVSAPARPMIDPVLAGPAADLLRARRDASGGLFTEIFLMDARGLNVAATDITSDYWQGDEDKWQKTFAIGPGSLHISEVELDESTQIYQAQISATVIDPATGKAIGAATFGVNVELLD